MGGILSPKNAAVLLAVSDLVLFTFQWRTHDNNHTLVRMFFEDIT